VYNRYGRRDNKYKARIKILVHELGVEEYRRQVAEEFAHMKTLGLNPPREELARIAEHFADPAYETGLSDDLDRSDPDFALWVDRNVARTSSRAMPSSISASSPSAASPAMRAPSRSELMADLAERYSLR
jgi:sulfite reductase (NADPH) hemoprotein beta-component